MKYAIQLKNNGVVIDYCETPKEAKGLSLGSIELIDTTKASVIKVFYTELSNPNNYGHSEESFATYGSIRKCISNLYKWMQETARVFGPSTLDIRDFFRYCHLEVNHKDKSEWLYNQMDKLDSKTVYV